MDQRLPSSNLEDGVFIQLNRRIINININEVIDMDSSKISIYIWGSDIGRGANIRIYFGTIQEERRYAIGTFIVTHGYCRYEVP